MLCATQCKYRERRACVKTSSALLLYALDKILSVSAAANNSRKQPDERSADNGDFSYDMLTNDEFSGEDIFITDQPDVCDTVVESIMTDNLKKAILKLTDEEQLLIYRHYYADISDTVIAEILRRISAGNQQADRQNTGKDQKTFRELKNSIVAPSSFRYGK